MKERGRASLKNETVHICFTCIIQLFMIYIGKKRVIDRYEEPVWTISLVNSKQAYLILRFSATFKSWAAWDRLGEPYDELNVIHIIYLAPLQACPS